MGYFANGTESMIYEQRYCARCIHNDDEQGCAVMALHLLYNYDEADKPHSFLSLLIPIGDAGENEECAMFVQKRSEEGQV